MIPIKKRIDKIIDMLDTKDKTKNTAIVLKELDGTIFYNNISFNNEQELKKHLANKNKTTDDKINLIIIQVIDNHITEQERALFNDYD